MSLRTRDEERITLTHAHSHAHNWQTQRREIKEKNERFNSQTTNQKKKKAIRKMVEIHER